jgi:hypothetical protein
MNPDIFENQSEVVDNIKKSAENLGVDVKVEAEKKKVPAAKKNCRLCWGQGLLTYCPPPRDRKDVPEKTTIACKCVRLIDI